MAIFTGSSGNETLIGSNADDVLQALGGTDVLRGRGGGDTYELFFNTVPVGSGPSYRIDETVGGDASVDRITGAGALMQYSIGGVVDYAGFKRVGLQGVHLVVDTAFKQNTHWVTGIESGTIKIINQHNGAKPNAQVELIEAGGVTYNLIAGNTGTAQQDILTGWKTADTLRAGGGADYLYGGRGRDFMYGEAGNDVLFGEIGNDIIYGGAGNDTMFGGVGRDRLFGGADDDVLDGGAVRDVLRGGNGNDTLVGGADNDRLIGGLDHDRLIGGDGNDRMTGSRGGDTYVVSSLGAGNDIVEDKGNAAINRYGWLTYNMDEVEFSDFTDLDEALHNVDLRISGDDLVISYTNPAALSVPGQVTIKGHFKGARFALEQVDFGTGGVQAIYHIAHLKGDDYTYSVHGGRDVGGNDIVLGTTGDDEIYGGIGSDIMLGGGGADRFMFHDEEDNRGGTDIILDFDIANDVLDFTDIKGFTRAGISVADNAHGNAQITSIYGEIELIGVTTAEVTDAIFDFR